MKRVMDIVVENRIFISKEAEIQIQKIRRWRKGGIVVQCHTRVYKLHNNNDANNSDHGVCYQQPVQAQLSVKGRANVWLPIGYKRALIKE